jgi:hypothetical protein
MGVVDAVISVRAFKKKIRKKRKEMLAGPLFLHSKEKICPSKPKSFE